VWQASRRAHAGRPLAFLDVGVLVEDPGDIQFRYWVDCRELDARRRPGVTWEAL